MRKAKRWHDSAPASCAGPSTSIATSGKPMSGTHGFWWPLQDKTQRKGQTKTFLQDNITKPWWPSVAHWRGPCDQDSKTGNKQTSRGNGNWLSHLNSFTAPPSLSFTPLTLNSLLSHLLTPIFLTPLHNTPTPQASHSTFCLWRPENPGQSTARKQRRQRKNWPAVTRLERAVDAPSQERHISCPQKTSHKSQRWCEILKSKGRRRT